MWPFKRKPKLSPCSRPIVNISRKCPKYRFGHWELRVRTIDDGDREVFVPHFHHDKRNDNLIFDGGTHLTFDDAAYEIRAFVRILWAGGYRP